MEPEKVNIDEQKLQQVSGLEQLYNLFMNAPVMIGILKGDECQLDFANEGMLTLLGKSKNTLCKPLYEEFPELKSEGLLQLANKVKNSGQTFKLHEQPFIFVRDGKEEVLYIDLIYQPFYEANSKQASGVICVAHDVTGQVQSRQRIKNVVEQAVDPILILMGENMILEEANDALLKLWKIDRSGLGQKLLDLQPEMEHQNFYNLLQQVYSTGKPIQSLQEPAVFNQPDGGKRTVYFNFTFQPYREPDGRISGVLVLSSDVTGQVIARREAEQRKEELRQSMERFELVSKATNDAIWDWNITTNLLVWNDAVYSMFGYNPKDIDNVDQWYVEHLHPDERVKILDSVQQSIAAGDSIWMKEYRFRCADGSYKIVYDRGFIQYDLQGQAVRMIGSMQDITSRKNYENFLNESQKKWQLLANAMPAVVWTTDSAGHTDYLNERWYEYTGLSEAESMGEGWMQVLHPDDIQECYTAWKLARKDDSLYQLELRYRGHEGYYRWFLARGIPIKNEDGVVIAWYGTSTDIHEQKMLSENLENLVAERTVELKKSNANLEEFAYAASHDLQEPIRKIKFYTDRLKQELSNGLSESQLNFFNRMENAANRMGTLIDDLLEYSKVSKGVEKLEEVNLNRLVQMATEDLEIEIQRTAARLNIAQLPILTGNQRQYQQLFQNLISNAIKYSKPGIAPEVHITARIVKGKEVKADLPGDHLFKSFYLIEVSDNGIGFDPAYAERIFNVFTRLHGNSEYKGTGVGLSIVRKVVENHNGFIWAESKPGEGSIFRILLPVTVSR